MPRPFDISSDSAAGVLQIHSAFADRSYWLARLAVYGGDSIVLDALDVDPDATVRVVTTQDMRHDVLPGPLAKVFPGDLLVRREEIWRRTGDGRVCGDVHITATGAPLIGRGPATLAAIADGSRLRFTGTVEVKIPLIGGQVEKYICGQVCEEIPGVNRFTADWIARHG